MFLWKYDRGWYDNVCSVFGNNVFQVFFFFFFFLSLLSIFLRLFLFFSGLSLLDLLQVKVGLIFFIIRQVSFFFSPLSSFFFI